MLRPYRRALAYTLLLLGALAGLTFWHHRTPSQVEARVERFLSTLVASPVRAHGCTQRLAGSIEIQELAVGALPRLESPDAILLSDVRVHDPPTAALLSDGVDSPDDGRTPLVAVHASRGALVLERTARAIDGAAAGSWSLAGVCRRERIFDRLKTMRFGMSIDDLEVTVVDLPAAPEARREWRTPWRHATLRWPDAGDVALDARLGPGPDWSRGRIEARVAPEGTVRMRGEIQGLRDASRWVALLSGTSNPMWRLLDDRATVDLQVEELTVRAGGPPGIRAAIRYYDAALRLGSEGLVVDRVAGTVRVEDASVRLGGPDAPALEGRLWGAPVTISGEATGADGRLEIALAPASIEAAESGGEAGSPSPGLVGRVLRSLGARGTVQGALALDVRFDGREDWEGDFEFREASVAAVPFIRRMDGTLRVDRSTPVAGPGERDTGGRGKILLSRLEVAGAGPSAGEVSFSWSGGTVRFKLYLEALLESDTPPRPAEPAEPRDRSGGSVFGTIGWSPGTGQLDAEVRCMGIAVSTALFACRDLSGDLRLAAGDPTPRCDLLLGGFSIPAGMLGEGAEEVRFDAAKCSLRLRDGRADVESLRALAADRCLRGRGDILMSGEVDLVLVVASAPGHLPLNALDDSTGPPEWKAAAVGGFRAYRIGGTVAHPTCRELSPSDGVFVRLP